MPQPLSPCAQLRLAMSHCALPEDYCPLTSVMSGGLISVKVSPVSAENGFCNASIMYC